MLSQSRKAAILEKFAQDQLMAGQKPPPPVQPVKSTSTIDSTGQVDPVTGRTFGAPAKKLVPTTTGAATKTAPAAKPAGGLEDWDVVRPIKI